MIHQDQVWYLPDINIDIVTCPKNGMTSIKNFFQLWYGTVNGRQFLDDEKAYRSTLINKQGTQPPGPSHLREFMVCNHSDFIDYPFRKGSFRIAVKRDPVKRFVSAVEYCQTKHPHKKVTERDYTHYESIGQVLDAIEDGKLYEHHFHTQTHFMGSIDRYHAVWDIQDLTHMFRYCVRKHPDLKWGPRLNPVLNTMRQKEDKRITSNLSDSDIARIKILYGEDYRNGWC